jgi:hypothetical protein
MRIARVAAVAAAMSLGWELALLSVTALDGSLPPWEVHAFGLAVLAATVLTLVLNNPAVQARRARVARDRRLQRYRRGLRPESRPHERICE